MSTEIYIDGLRFIPLESAVERSALSADYLQRLGRRDEIQIKEISGKKYVSDPSLSGFLAEREALREARREELARKRAAEYTLRNAQLAVTPKNTGARFVVPKVAAAEAGLSVDYMHKLAKSGAIATGAVGEQTLIDRDSMHAFILERAHKAEVQKQTLKDARAIEYSREHSRTRHVVMDGQKLLAAAPTFTQIAERAVALAMALTITFGLYASVDPQYARFALDAAEGGMHSMAAHMHAPSRIDALNLAAAASVRVRTVTENPSAMLAGAATSITAFAKLLNSSVNGLVYAIAFPDALTRSSGSVAVDIQPYAAPQVAPVASNPSIAAAPTKTAQTIIQNPVIERVIEKAVPQTIVQSGGITADYLSEKLNELDNKLSSKMYSLSSANSTVISQNYNVTAQTNRIDKLANVSIDNPSITGGSISGTSIAAADLSVSGKTTLADTSINGDITLSGSLTMTATSSSSGLVATNATLTNLTATNATSTNLYSDVASSTNLFAANAQLGVLAVGTLNLAGLGTFAQGFVSQASSTIAASFTVTGPTALTGTLDVLGTTTLGELTATNATTTNFFASIASSTSLYAQTAALGDLSANTGLFRAATSTSFFASVASSTNLFAQSAALGDLSANTGIFVSATSTNFVSTNATTTNFFTNRLSVGSLNLGSGVTSSIVPAANKTYDLGSPSFFWRDSYIDTLTVNNISAASTSIGGTASNNFTINSDNATADAEDMSLIFFRGVVVPNALIAWNSAANAKRFEFNQATYIANQSGSTTQPTLTLKGAIGQTGNIFQIASSSGATVFSVASDGGVTISTSTITALVSGTSSITNLTVSNTSTSTFAGGASLGALSVSGASTLSSATIENATSTSFFASVASSTNLFAQNASVGSLTSSALTLGTLNLSGLATLASGFVSQASSTVVGNFTATGVGHIGTGTARAYDTLHVGASTHPVITMEDVGSGVGYLGVTGQQTVLGGEGDIAFKTGVNFASGPFSTGTTRLFVQNSTGNVGIGTSTPQSALQVQGGNVYIDVGNLYGFYNPGTGQLHSYIQQKTNGILAMYSANGGGIQLATNGFGTAVTVANAGNVGIGTTTPIARLSVSNTASSVAASFSGFSEKASVGIGSTSDGPFIQGYTNFLSATTNLALNATGGNVGVGTSTPGFKLQVSGDATYPNDVTNGGAQFSIGGATAPTKRINIGYDTSVSGNGFGYIAAGNLGTAWTSLALQPTGGNVGIGTTTPSNALSLTAAAGNNVYLGIDATVNAGLKILNASAEKWRIDNITTDNHLRVLAGASVDALDILQNGNVGIGTSSPPFKLTVQGSDNSNTANFVATNLAGAPTFAVRNDGTIGIGTTAPFSGYALGGTAIGKGLAIHSGTDNDAVGYGLDIIEGGNNRRAALFLDDANATWGLKGTASSGGVGDFLIQTGFGVEALRILNSNQNVGIGTTNPGSKLEVQGQVAAQNFTATSTTATSTFAGGLTVGGSNFNVAPNGNLGIGTANDGAFALELTNPNGTFAQFTRTGVGTMIFGMTGGGGASSGNYHDTADFQFQPNSTSQGQIFYSRTTSAGTLTPALYINNTSDVLLGTTTTQGNGHLVVNAPSYNYTPTIFAVSSSTANATTNLFNVMANGNVGISAAAPATTLEVHVPTAGATPTVRISNDGSATGNPTLDLYRSAAESAQIWLNAGGNGLNIESNRTDSPSNSSIRFLTFGNNERVRIDGNGLVGIGTTTPTANLAISGTTGQNLLQVATSTNQSLLVMDQNGNLGVNGTPSYKLDVTGGTIGSTIPTGTTPIFRANTLNTANAIGFSFYNAKTDPNPLFQIRRGATALNSAILEWGDSTGAVDTNLFRNTAGVLRTNGSVVVDGSIGIGTTSPSSKLTVEVAGGANGNNPIASSIQGIKIKETATNGSYGDVGLLMGGGGTSGNYAFVAAHKTDILNYDLSLGVNSVEAVRILSNGNVGIGTTTPSQQLSVNGKANIGLLTSSVTSPAVLDVGAANNNNGIRLLNTSLAGTIGWDLYPVTNGSNSDMRLFEYSSGTSADRMTFQAGGNVGIGSTAPGAKLEVSATPGLPATTGSTQTGGMLRLSSSGGNNAVLDIGGDFASTGNAWLQAANKNALGTNFALLLNPNGGNVGVGTASPASTLDVHGRLTFSGHNQAVVGNPSITSTVSTPNSILEFHSPTNGGSGGGWYGVEDFYTSFNGGAEVLTMRLRNQNVGIGSSTPFARLSVKGAGTGTGVNFQTTNSSDAPLFSILDNGNVGIGTTTPQRNLSVQGTTWIGGTAASVDFADNGAGELMRFSGVGPHGIYTSGFSSQLKIDASSLALNSGSNGNVGIGTSSPQSKLAVSGNATIGADYNTGGPANGLAVEGNVGIGLSNPSDKLHVGGNVAGAIGESIFNTNAGGTSNLFFNYTSTGGVGSNNLGRIWSATAGNDLFIGTGQSGGSAADIIFKSSVASPGAYDTEIMRLTRAGNVGIGTIAPKLKLEVAGANAAESGTATPNGGLLVGNGTAANSQILTMGVLDGAGNHAWIQSRNNSTTGVYPLALNPSGGSVLAGGTAAVTVPGTATIQALGANSGIWSIGNSGGQGAVGAYDKTTGHVGAYLESNNGYAGIATINNAGVYTGEPLRITSTGLGIGMTPTVALDVAGLIHASDSITSYGSGGGFFASDRATSGTGGLYRSGGINRLWDSAGGDIINYNSTSVGIGAGNYSPGATLDVLSNSQHAYIGDPGCGAGYIGIGMISAMSACANYRILANASDTFINRPTGGALRFRENNGATDQMTIASGGNVGIGTVAPGFKLDVNGIINAPLTSGYYLGGSQVILSGGNYMNFYSSAPGSGAALTLGNAADPSVYANGTNTYIRSQNGASTFATFNATGLSLGGPLTMNRNAIYLAGAGDTNHAIGNGLETINGTSDGETINGWQFIDLYAKQLSKSALYVSGTTANVGIGSTNPGAKLSIANGADDPTNYGKALQITNVSGNRQQMAFIRNGSNVVSAGYNGASSVWGFGTGNVTDASFVPNYLSMDNATGFVGVGTASPHATFEVSTPSSPNGDGITMGQTNGDNTESIQAYIDGHYSDRATYASGCCNVLQLQPDVGTVQLGGAVTVDHAGNIAGASAVTANGIITSNQVGSPGFQVNGAAGNTRYTRILTSGSVRWDYGADNVAESGGNAGSNFFINEFNDSGGYIATPLSITRSTAKVTLSNDLGVGGSITSAGNVNITGSGCFMISGVCIGTKLGGIFSASTAVSNVAVVFTGAAGSAPSLAGSTLTLPNNTAYVTVETWGAGGGGAGGNGGSGSTGGTSCFGTNSTACTSPTISATGGTGGTAGAGAGGGGAGSGGDINLTGGSGGISIADNGSAIIYVQGGEGGSAPRGGGGGTSPAYSSGTSNPGAAFGGGGAGGSINGVSGEFSGAGGGGGGYAEKLINTPSGTYYYTIGSGGGGGTAGVGGAGAAGGAGGIVITVYVRQSNGADIAENYPVADPSVEAGDIVGTMASTSLVMQKADGTMPLVGVISTQPGEVLGDHDQAATGQRPVALAGRVPVKVNYENGDIHAGDRIAVSSIAGVGRKASAFESSVGIALEDHLQATATGDTVTVFLDLEQGISVADLGAALVHSGDGTASSTSAYDFVGSFFGTMVERLSGGEDISYLRSTTTVEELMSASSSVASSTPWTSSFADASDGLKHALASIAGSVVHVLARAIYATNAVFEKVFAKEVDTDTLCVTDASGKTCITRAQLDALLAGAGAAAPGGSAGATNDASTTPSDASSTPSTDPSGQDASSTADTIAPTLSINGANPAVLQLGDTYADLGVTVSDNVDQNMSVTAVLDGGQASTVEHISIDTTIAGTHTILYSVSDQAGNTSTATRTVQVIDPNATVSNDAGADTTDTANASTTDATSTNSGEATTTPDAPAN